MNMLVVHSSVDPEDTTPDSAVDTGSSTVQTQEVCTISEECFQVPPTYRRLNTGSYSMANEEEELLQLAIRQSLLEQGEGDPEEQLSLREALGDQTLMGSGHGGVVSRCGPNADDEELEFALALSRHLEEEEARKRRHEEEDSRDEESQRILKLSLELSLEEK
ncbi:uncharacterized protein LOC135339370 isoform X1 [Halichondria panicea]|uniref:uncharacterized protein LOC135339370 isoform X1 n=1 Tax=Halichondria panicea TaxID=6063 RepID=UPI00312BC68E